MPDGYLLEGIKGMDGGRALYCWSQYFYEGSISVLRYGPYEFDKRKAVRQAWRDFKSRGEDPTAVEAESRAKVGWG